MKPSSKAAKVGGNPSWWRMRKVKHVRCVWNASVSIGLIW